MVMCTGGAGIHLNIITTAVAAAATVPFSSTSIVALKLILFLVRKKMRLEENLHKLTDELRRK